MARIAQLIDILQGSGIDAGDVLVFEAPGLTPSNVEGGLENLAIALQALVGPSGTLVVPTCTPAEGYPKPVFDPLQSPSEMGPFPEMFRALQGVVRSHSPTHSVSARGPSADNLIAGHRTAAGRPTPWGGGPFGYGSPWDLLYECNAWWVLVETDEMSPDSWTQTPFTAYVQALFADRQRGLTKHTAFPRFNPAMLGRKLQQLGCLHRAVWGPNTVMAFQTRPAIDTALATLQDSPSSLEPAPEVSQWLATVHYLKQHGYLQAGIAKKKITPPVPCLRWEGKQLTGVYRDLYVRVVVLAHGSDKIALVLCDLLGISRELVQRIRTEIQARIDFPAGAIQIACTHSHSTPDTVGSGFEDPVYLDSMVDTIVDAVCKAAINTQPARLGWDRIPIRGLARNRRKKMTDGTVFTTRYGVPSTWRVAPEIIVGEGPTDPDLTAVRIEDLSGEVLAAVSNFACHPSVALMSPNISGDFFGEAMAILEEIMGDPSVVLCTNGAAADVDPTAEMPCWGPRDDRMARRLGRIFSAQVLECLERIEVQEITPVGFAQELVDLPVRPDWIQLFESGQERMQQEFSKGWQLSSVTKQILRERIIHTEVQALRLNDLILFGFPGEVFAETGLQLKAKSQNCSVAVVELANDDIGYIPTAQAFLEGGYEVGQHLWGRITPEATDLLVAAGGRVIERLTDD
ncbi:MAG: neutral/alkaline non-lysosomal ceramidase N-terminal domain-containing protein [Chloroflexota bacterium]|nr:neutral/alkaline non-lysosomal ceramidase N-terminal domain-containing protein [Chloroflexota bacterium]